MITWALFSCYLKQEQRFSAEALLSMSPLCTAMEKFGLNIQKYESLK